MKMPPPVTNSRLAREFLLSLQRARANQQTITVHWEGASVNDMAMVSAYLDDSIAALIEQGIAILKGVKDG